MFYVAAIVGTLASFIVGCLWYSVIFGRKWQNDMGFSDEKVKSIFVPRRILLAFLSEWFATACIVGILYNAGTSLVISAIMVTVAIMFSGIKLAIFDGKKLSTVLINQGYTILSILIIALSFKLFLG